jgi:hypothetical protein
VGHLKASPCPASIIDSGFLITCVHQMSLVGFFVVAVGCSCPVVLFTHTSFSAARLLLSNFNMGNISGRFDDCLGFDSDANKKSPRPPSPTTEKSDSSHNQISTISPSSNAENFRPKVEDKDRSFSKEDSENSVEAEDAVDLSHSNMATFEESKLLSMPAQYFIKKSENSESSHDIKLSNLSQPTQGFELSEMTGDVRSQCEAEHAGSDENVSDSNNTHEVCYAPTPSSQYHR